MSTSTGSWKPQLHFVWTIILDLYYPQQLERSGYPAGHAPFQDFFRVLVDGAPATFVNVIRQAESRSPQNPSSPIHRHPNANSGASKSWSAPFQSFRPISCRNYSP